MTKAEFIPTIAPLVVAENKKRGNPLFSSVVIAQAICETGWGQSRLMMKAKAIFGIKASKDWKGKVYNSLTHECYDGAHYTEITACFRAYNSFEESIADYFDLITKLSRYRKACVATTPLECITAIKEGGYATSPTYVSTIMSIINSNNLTRFDNVENVEKPVDKKYIIGKTYTLKVNLKVRYGAGILYGQKHFKELTKDGQKHAFNQEFAVLKKGTRVTCLDIIIENNNIWLKIPSGYVAGYYEGKEYIC